MIFNDELIKRYFMILSIGVVVLPVEAIDFTEETFTFFTDYKITTNDSILINEVRSAQACGSVCLTTSDCCAVSYISNTRECYLDTSGTCSSPTVPCVGSMVMIKQMYAVPDGNDPVLPTVGGDVTDRNYPVQPKDCEDVAGGNGTYTIYPSTGNDFNVYCEVGSDNQYWTIIQRRVDGQKNFYRTWQAYKMGFGDLANEFWLGIIKL